MGILNNLFSRSEGGTYDGQGEERHGMIDVIKYNGLQEDLVWKFPYDNLSTGSQLVVNQSQEAIFVKGGAVYDVFGPGTHTLSANNLPLLEKIVNLPFGGRSPFKAEVWFVNKVTRRGLGFGTPEPIRVIDPLYTQTQMAIPVRARGDYSIRIADGQLLLKEFVGTQHLFTTDEFEDKFFTMIIQELNRSIKVFSREKQISPLDFPEYGPDIAEFIQNILREKFAKYGVSLEDFQFEHIAPNEDDPVVKKLYDNRLQAMTERERRDIQGFTYQQERQFDVLETAAGNEGSGQSTMMGAGLGMGMGVGMGGMFSQQMQQVSQQAMSAQQVPPPPPVMNTTYYLYINGSQQGPFDANTLRTLAQSGTLTRDTLVWRQGMAQWDKAANQPDLQMFFGAVPPPPPPVI